MLKEASSGLRRAYAQSVRGTPSTATAARRAAAVAPSCSLRSTCRTRRALRRARRRQPRPRRLAPPPPPRPRRPRRAAPRRPGNRPSRPADAAPRRAALDAALAIEPETRRTCNDRRRRRERAARRRGWGNGSSKRSRCSPRARTDPHSSPKRDFTRSTPRHLLSAPRHGDAAAALGGAFPSCTRTSNRSSARSPWATTPFSAASAAVAASIDRVSWKLLKSCAPPTVPSTELAAAVPRAIPVDGGADDRPASARRRPWARQWMLAKVSVSEVLLFLGTPTSAAASCGLSPRRAAPSARPAARRSPSAPPPPTAAARLGAGGGDAIAPRSVA